MTIQERRLKVLEETAAHYNANNRGISSSFDTCCYYSIGDDGQIRKCAIGRLLPDELARALPNYKVGDDNLWPQLPKEVRELGGDFLHELQRFHDIGLHWNEQGLSDDGKTFFDGIKTKFDL